MAHVSKAKSTLKKFSFFKNEKIIIIILGPVTLGTRLLNLIVNIVNKFNLHLIRVTYTCTYYFICLVLSCLYISCFTSESVVLLYINVLKYFYSSLYLHVLFAYVFVLCCIYTVFTEYYGLVNAIQFIVSMR